MLKSYKVLLVDDTISIHAYIKFMLEQGVGSGVFQLTAIASAEDMFEYIEEDLPDLILLDINLPRMDGLTACSKLHLSHPEVPVIIITAEFGAEDLMVKARNMGAADFLTKPFNSDKLLSHINLVLGNPAISAEEQIRIEQRKIQRQKDKIAHARDLLDYPGAKADE